MFRKIVLFFGFLLLIGCQKSIDFEDLTLLNGYWEIDKVTMPDGNSKLYEINQTADYIFFKDNKGFRKKVAPQYDGTYLVTEHQETFEVEEIEGNFILKYSTEYGDWTEKLIDLSDTHFSVENEQKIFYTYKKQVAFSVK